MDINKKLYEIEIGKFAVVHDLNAQKALQDRLLALGVTKGATIEVLRKGPKHNLTLYKIRGAMIALREEEASTITVSVL